MSDKMVRYPIQPGAASPAAARAARLASPSGLRGVDSTRGIRTETATAPTAMATTKDSTPDDSKADAVELTIDVQGEQLSDERKEALAERVAAFIRSSAEDGLDGELKDRSDAGTNPEQPRGVRCWYENHGGRFVLVCKVE